MPPRAQQQRQRSGRKKPRGRWGKDPDYEDGREYTNESDAEEEEEGKDNTQEFPQRTMKEKLVFLNVDLNDLERVNKGRSGGLHEEFKIIKKRYYREALLKHPDKGGKERDFLELDFVWQSLRVMYERNTISSYWEEAQKKGAEKKKGREYTRTRQAKKPQAATKKRKKKGGKEEEEEEEFKAYHKAYRSYKFYEEAAEYDDPEYRVELARSVRSSCVAKTGGIACEHAHENIEKDEIRCGHRNPTSGSFGNWSHLRCWRVPKRVWLGLPDAHLGPLEKEKKSTKKEKKPPQGDEEEKKETKTTAKRRGRSSKTTGTTTTAKGKGTQPSMDRRVALVEEEGDFTLTEEQFAEYNDAISKMNEDLLEGFIQLKDDDQRAFVLHCANRKNWAVPRGVKSGEGFDLALLPFEGKKTGAWGTTHKSEVAVVPGALEAKKRLALQTKRQDEEMKEHPKGYPKDGRKAHFSAKAIVPGAKDAKKQIAISAAAVRKEALLRAKQEIAEKVKQEEENQANWDLLNAHLEARKGKGEKRKAPSPAPAAVNKKKKPVGKKKKQNQIVAISESELDDDEREGGGNNEDLAVAHRQTQQHLVPLNQMRPLVTVPATARALAGKTFVMTGVFPELGGGVGLSVGKDKARALIETFGGVVRSAISGQTTHLLVGTEPGASKVSQARSRNVTLVNVGDLQKCLNLGDEAAREELGQDKVIIEAFSGGFYGNSKAYEMSSEKLQYLAGLKDLDALPPAPPKPKPPKSFGARLLSWKRK